MIVALEETASTNADAIEMVRSGERSPPFWVTAQRQTAGKGRDGRAWVSLDGNMHASLAVALDCEMRVAPQVALVAGVGVIDALQGLARGRNRLGSGELQLKWPNDILIGNAKCGGILVQTTVEPDAGRLVAVIGVGLNVVGCPIISGRLATSLAASGFDAETDQVFRCVASAMDAALQVWDFGRGFRQIRARWLDAATRIGTPMSVHAAGAVCEGYFAGLDEDGALLLRDARGETQRFWFGDVVL